MFPTNMGICRPLKFCNSFCNLGILP